MTDTSAPGIGHNSTDALDDALGKGFELLAQAARVPSPLPDLDTAQRAVALVKMLRLAAGRCAEVCDDLTVDWRAKVAAVEDRAEPVVKALEQREAAVQEAVHAFRVKEGLPKIVSDFGPTAHGRTRDDIAIEAANLPREFLAPDMKAIKAALKAGRTIEGVTVTPTTTTVIS